METNPLSKRDGSVDLAKSLAVCAVLLIHCSANRFALYDVGSAPWLLTAFWGTVSRWAVPLFLMCSGALMNDPGKEVPLKKLFSRYLLRLVLALSVWAGLYELLRVYLQRGAAPLSALLVQGAKNWLYGDTYYHLYYFYFAIALYLALPLTRLIACHATDREARYLLALWLFAGGVMPYLKCFPPFSAMGSSLLYYVLPAAFLCPGLGLLGWYLHQHPSKSWLAPAALFIACFAVVFLGTWRRSAAAGTLDAMHLNAFDPFVLLMAACLFRLCQWLAGQMRTSLRPAALLSRASFCIYLIHPFFQWLTRQSFFEALPPLWGVPIQAALLLGLSLISYLVLRKIPLVGRWLI